MSWGKSQYVISEIQSKLDNTDNIEDMWIHDLATFGSFSYVANDDYKKTRLCKNASALNNSCINYLLFEHAIKNKLHIGLIFKSINGSNKSLDWENYITINDVLSNSTSLEDIFTNDTSRNVLLSNNISADIAKIMVADTEIMKCITTSEVVLTNYTVYHKNNFISLLRYTNTIPTFCNSVSALKLIANDDDLLSNFVGYPNTNMVFTSGFAMKIMLSVDNSLDYIFDRDQLVELLITNREILDIAMSIEIAADRLWHHSLIGKALTLYIDYDYQTYSLFNSIKTLNILVSSYYTLNAIISNNTIMELLVKNEFALNTLLDYSQISILVSSASAMQYIIKCNNDSLTFLKRIQSARTTLIQALNSSDQFIKTSVTLDADNGEYEHGINSNSIYIPISCTSDQTVIYTVFSGNNADYMLTRIATTRGNTIIGSSVALKGIKVIGIGTGSITFDVYTAI